VISRAFAVVFSRMRVRIRCPDFKVSLLEVYDKAAGTNGLLSCFCLKIGIRLRQSIHGRKKWADQQSLDCVLSCMSICVAVGISRRIVQPRCRAKPFESLVTEVRKEGMVNKYEKHLRVLQGKN
jgi:hypothetical protein